MQSCVVLKSVCRARDINAAEGVPAAAAFVIDVCRGFTVAAPLSSASSDA